MAVHSLWILGTGMQTSVPLPPERRHKASNASLMLTGFLIPTRHLTSVRFCVLVCVMRMTITIANGFHRIVLVYYFTVKRILMQHRTQAVYGGAMHIGCFYLIAYIYKIIVTVSASVRMSKLTNLLT